MSNLHESTTSLFNSDSIFVIITLLFTPILVLVSLVIGLASFGASFGLRRMYVKALLKIFEYATNIKEEKIKECEELLPHGKLTFNDDCFFFLKFVSIDSHFLKLNSNRTTRKRRIRTEKRVSQAEATSTRVVHAETTVVEKERISRKFFPK
jgi:hypothetical protein